MSINNNVMTILIKFKKGLKYQGQIKVKVITGEFTMPVL